MNIHHFLKRDFIRNISLSAVTAITLASCTAANSVNSKIGKAQPNIINTQWKLADNLKGKQPTLIIENSKVTGNGGCNNYFADALIDSTAGNFSVSRMGSTKKACDNMNEESTYFTTLSAANKYVVSGDVLELYKDNLLLLKFTKL